MIKAAGILIQATSGRVLFLLRGPGGDHPLEWAFAGGQLESGEDSITAAVREAEEETGMAIDPADLVEFTRGVAPAELVEVALDVENPSPPSEEVDFTAYAMRKPVEEFTPSLCDESIGWAWAPPDQPPQPLHPGCRIALERPAMNELGVARAIAAGRLTSPQVYENITLFAIRISGTGMSYRPQLEEFVWRRPEIWLTQEAIDRCAGLPVIWRHPPKLLDSKEFSERIGGVCMFGYVKGDELWAMARMYDDEAIAWMRDPAREVSTSPGVNFKARSGHMRAFGQNGEAILVEGNPTLFDHVAICGIGVWDKNGPSLGVDLTGVEMAMADEFSVKPSISLADVLALQAQAITMRALSIR